MEPFLEPPIAEPPMELLPDPKNLKRMKKKLDELNRKIRRSKKKNNGLICSDPGRNSDPSSN